MTPDETRSPAGWETRSLIVGYGNPDRQDDGIAGHVLEQLSVRLGRAVLFSAADLAQTGATVGPQGEPAADLLEQLQLTPEIVEAFTAYDRIIFVDAYSGAGDREIEVKEVASSYQSSPLSHHMTPETCMALLRSLYQHPAPGYLVSIRGYEFGFSRSLSARTHQLLEPAVEQIIRLISQNSPSTR